MDIKFKVKNFIRKVDTYLPKPIFYKFLMSPLEKELFDKRIKNSAAYLEFGMGGSTFRVLQKSKAKVYTIDSSKEWIEIMRKYRQVRTMEKKNRLSLFHVDIGPTREWGRPITDEHKEKFPNYSSKMFNMIDGSSIDTVLIDGRFRVACALKTTLECNENKNLQIIIHDFFNRERYHILLKYFNVIDRADSLGIFEIKSDVNLNAVKDEYEIYKYDVE